MDANQASKLTQSAPPSKNLGLIYEMIEQACNRRESELAIPVVDHGNPINLGEMQLLRDQGYTVHVAFGQLHIKWPSLSMARRTTAQNG